MGGGAGAWSVLNLFVVDDPLVVFGGRRRWRVERPHNSVRNRRPCRDFWGGGSAGAWSVLNLFVVDDPLVVFGGWRRWQMERPDNSCRNRPPSRRFRWAALARGASGDSSSESLQRWRRRCNAFPPVPRGTYTGHTQHRTYTASRAPQQLHCPRRRTVECIRTRTS